LQVESVPEYGLTEATRTTIGEKPKRELTETKPELESVEALARREGQRAGRRAIHHLRLRTFLHVLQHRLDCEVRPGKGDETTIYRQGGKIFRIGRPEQIHPVIVKRALRRLNISIPEWLKALGC